MPAEVVTYALDDSTKVRFEIDPPVGFQEASPDKVIGQVQDALGPAIETAKLVLEKAKDARPDEVSVTFGIKVSGKLDWFVAKAAAEGNFEITLVWKHRNSKPQSTGSYPVPALARFRVSFLMTGVVLPPLARLRLVRVRGSGPGFSGGGGAVAWADRIWAGQAAGGFGEVQPCLLAVPGLREVGGG